MKILIIEDEKELQEVIKTSLEREKFIIETADNFHTALEKVSVYNYDCILLDIMLPGGSGFQLLEKLKELKKEGSVIIISAKHSLDDKLRGLGMGADDYLTKPFHIAELNARVKSVLRRNHFGGKPNLEVGNLSLDPDERSIHIAGKPLTLNRKEFDILTYFLANKNRLLTKTALAEHVWGDYIDQADDYEFIYSQIKNLRRKLKAAGALVEITAIYGIGYKLEEQV